MDWVIGRDFWGFISDDPECAKLIFRIVQDVATHFVPDKGEPFPIRYQKKVEELAEAITKKYGKGGNEMWQKLFEDNM